MKFIAECGLNHNGNLDLTYELIRQAAWSGADIVKFQLGWKGEEGEMNNIDSDRLKKIVDFCEYMEVEPMFSIFNKKSFDMITGLNLKRIKVASRTVIDDTDLVEEMLKENYKFYISLGMWHEDHLPFAESKKIDYLWCISKYPSMPEDLKEFPKNFTDSPYSGYSDHTIGIESALLAISRGAEVVEKHFTLDKSDTTIRDHALSSTPDEFESLVKLGKEIHKLVKAGV